MNDDAPTLPDIIQLTREKLTTTGHDDCIRECGRAAVSLLSSDAELCLKLAYQKLHDVPYKDVKTCWRRLYVDASLWQVLKGVEEQHLRKQDAGDAGASPPQDKNGLAWLDETVRRLDMALILTAAPGREELVELWFAALKRELHAYNCTVPDDGTDASERPAKRRKLSPSGRTSRLPSRFPADLPDPAPALQHPIPRMMEPNLARFQARLDDVETHSPLVIEGAIQHWPALEERPWGDPGYLLGQTLGGRRLVPVEVGKSYIDEAWGQRIIMFEEFMETYMLDGRDGDDCVSKPPNGKPENEDHDAQPDHSGRDNRGRNGQTGYLAQHDLFAQIAALRADISIPDYCYCEPAPSPHLTHIKSTPKLEEPLLNAWFGPAGTISPLHTDPYHNILAQVVGYKYIRLYAPAETKKLYPRCADETGVDMSNTSQIDLDDAMAVYPSISCWTSDQADNEGCEIVRQQKDEFEERFPDFKHAVYIEGVLAPGECLYLPVGWWHYVRSLTPSFSVSFWFN